MPAEVFPNYVDAISLAGGTFTEDETVCDGLLLPGGGDLAPSFYGQTERGSDPPDAARDERELSLCHRFLDRKKPILGICRGQQVLAVALGGTLFQHIEGHSRLPNGADRIHETRNAGLLAALYGPSCPVNSAHHQAIDRPPPRCQILQVSEDGVIEAFCHESLPVLAVQWHPERLCGRFSRPDAVNGLPLLRAFLALCGREP